MIDRLITLAVSALLIAPPQTQAETFCQRLAPKLNMKLVTTMRGKQEIREWKANQLGGIGPLLVGGSTVMSISVQPSDDGEPGGYARLAKACATGKKGVLCDIDGPATIVIGTKKGEVTQDIAKNEKAIVEVRGTSIYCREPQS